YSLYGHTVLTVADDSTSVDAVFNYGYFDSSQPDFLYRFLRGETDYVLGVTSFNDFLLENQMKGVEVVSQELILTKEQKQQLWEDLYINALPENRRYRYNYFYDNCATRPRDIVEKVVNRPVIYPATNSNQTFRDLIHECVGEFSWMEFGIDLLIGSDADKYITDREKMFLPVYLMHAFADAKVHFNDTISSPLVKSTEILLKSDNQDTVRHEWSIIKPVPIAFALLILTLVISFFQARFHHDKTGRIYDTILFFVAGAGGVIAAFLVFFSEHPATNLNWNLVWLHPIHLFIAILFWLNPFKKVVYWYHFINFALLSLFLLGWYFIPQQLPLATIPFAMSLWIRSGTVYLIQRKEYLKNKQFKSAKDMQAGWRH
ncbi:MAG: DUF4105 domain-containing protein, partial [Dysgonamonadaceae bacterium]|nr:DUF4105 domain-containing protein [Dysgonamonadaceae bacterium]